MARANDGHRTAEELTTKCHAGASDSRLDTAISMQTKGRGLDTTHTRCARRTVEPVRETLQDDVEPGVGRSEGRAHVARQHDGQGGLQPSNAGRRRLGRRMRGPWMARQAEWEKHVVCAAEAGPKQAPTGTDRHRDGVQRSPCPVRMQRGVARVWGGDAGRGRGGAQVVGGGADESPGVSTETARASRGGGQGARWACWGGGGGATVVDGDRGRRGDGRGRRSGRAALHSRGAGGLRVGGGRGCARGRGDGKRGQRTGRCSWRGCGCTRRRQSSRCCAG